MIPYSSLHGYAVSSDDGSVADSQVMNTGGNEHTGTGREDTKLGLLDSIVNRDSVEDRRRITERLAYFNDKAPVSGVRPLDGENGQPPWPVSSGIPEIPGRDFNDPALRSAMATAGCLIVRGYFDSREIAAYRDVIDRVMELTESTEESRRHSQANPDVFQNPPSNLTDLLPEPKLGNARSFNRKGGSALCVESAGVCEHLLEFFERTGVREIVLNYLGEQPCLAARKWVLRRPKTPIGPDGWHQDGAFMGAGINSLNMWIPVSRCGGDSGAPSMDVVSKRLRHIVGADTGDGIFEWSVGEKSLAGVLADADIVTPQFEPGDVFFFDHFLIHRTQHADQFTAPRYAIETWFFGEKNFPANQVPLRW